MIDLSVVVPVFSEEKSLVSLHEKLSAVLGRLDKRYEILFVNDGSVDDSQETLASLAQKDPRVRVVEFRRNIGKAAALATGFHYSRGAVVITLDADLQDDPEEIPRFLRQIEEGWDLVCGWKFPRRDSWRKTIPSWILNRCIRTMTGLRLHDINCGFKAYRRPVVEAVRLYGELHRYVPLLAHAFGFRITEIQVRHHPRPHGRSKYGLWQQLTGVLDLFTVFFLTRFHRKPIHLLGCSGLVSFGVGLVLALYLSWIRLFGGQWIGHRPLLLLSVFLMLVGIQMLFFGLLAEMFVALHREEDSESYIRSVIQRPDSPEVVRS